MAARDDVAAALRPPLTYRLTSTQWLAIDFVAAAVATATVLYNVEFLHGLHYHPGRALIAAVAVAGTAPVAVRRIWPLPVLALVTASCCVLTAHGRPPYVVDFMLGMAIYTAAVRCRRATAAAVLAAVMLALGAVALYVIVGHRGQVDVARNLLVAGALWFVGDSVRERRKYRAGLADQAAQQQRIEAERSRQAVREERIRIARELHDVVAHSLGVVTVQAGVGRKVGAAQPGEALRALRAVEVTGRSALEELRRILGLLRDEDEGPSLAPTPGIEDLNVLVASVRAAGVPVRLDVTANAAALPPAAAMTVYRIVQEALTNVVKHARAAEASVGVRTDPDRVRIAVTDDGRGSLAGVGQGPGGARLGIVGMQERAAAFGGTLDAGPLPGGGFGVTAFLPVRSDRPPPEPGASVGQVA
jgi:signal transduction histidine kinase